MPSILNKSGLWSSIMLRMSKKWRHHQHHLRRVTRNVFVSILFRCQRPDWSVLGIQNFQSKSSSVRVGQMPGHVDVGSSF